VKAVEVSEGEHGMHEPRRARVIWKVKNLHALLVRPSHITTGRSARTPLRRRALWGPRAVAPSGITVAELS
jgi:hypothetical protein